MSNRQRGGKNSAFEKNFKSRFFETKLSLDKSANKITRIITESLVNANKSNIYWRKVNRKIELEYKKMVDTYDKFAKDEIPLQYRNSLRALNKRIINTKTITNKAKRSISNIINSLPSRQIMASLYLEAIEDFKTSAAGGLNLVKKFTRATQQVLIRESEINLAVAASFESGNLRNIVKLLRTTNPQFARIFEMPIEDRYLVAGGKRFKPSYYAEMVCRVKFHEAQANAALVTATNYDTDLILVSNHNTRTVICQDFEGKIFSMEGKDKRFPILMQTPPFHVNCLHLLFPYFDSSFKNEKEAQQWSDFSNNKVDRPPFPKGFVPISDRGEQ